MLKIFRNLLVAAFVAFFCVTLAPVQAATLDDAKALAEKAAVLVSAEGEKAFPKLADPNGEFIQGELYVVVVDQQGIMRAHRNPKLVGMNMWDEEDPDGVKFTQDAVKIATTTGGGWQTYKFPNPVTKKIATKKAWVQKAGDFVVICGAYVN